ncbi:MAG TPA: metallophosphoesterase, partial [Gemmatimonadaceae bacterium]
WGDPRIMRAIRPSPGNHDYATQAGAAYYRYFGARAGPAGQGYYSYDVGQWHAIALNSEIVVGPWYRPEGAKAQEEWLRRDIEAHRNKCTLAYFHRPLFTSGVNGPTYEVRSLWNIMYEGGVDLILNGHDHHYERFLPQTPLGVRDEARGIEEIIVGTGGGDLRGVKSPLAANSIVEIHGYFGVLKLTLGTDEYRHAFIDASGRIWDTGGRKCH